MKLILALSLLVFSSVSQGESVKQPAEVMLMGTFHFNNPGLDVVKTRQINVSTAANQAYLTAFTERLAESFAPTHVLMECDRGNQEKLNAEYQNYLLNKFELPINEIYQIGFRLGKKSGIKALHCYDEREVQWQAEALFNSISESEPELKLELDQTLKGLSESINKMHQELSLAQILTELNSEGLDKKNKSMYILTNEVGANGNGFAGADAAASWWHRNFRMYANIQKHATPESRLFVIGGHGHTSILNDMLDLDEKRQAKLVKPYL